MEALIVVVIGAVVILPLVAFILSLLARKGQRRLEWRLLNLEDELSALKRRFGAPPSGPSPAQQPAASPAPEQAPAPFSLKDALEKRAAAFEQKMEPTAPPPPPSLEPALQSAATAGQEPPAKPFAPPPLAPPSFLEPPPSPEPLFQKFGLKKFNWEQFMGVRMFAWLGGLALFLAAAFFVKYSFEHDLIPPEVRVAIGFLTGLGLLVGGMMLSRKAYTVTAHTLCATGVVILYAVTFACRAVYHFPFFESVPTFGLMVLITTVAFLVAVRLKALVVAVLGMLGGFLTPVLLSTGQDNPVGLFAYIALLDVGLMAVASVRRWDWLNVASAAGTVLMQIGWTVKFFEVQKVFIAMTVFLGFDALYLAGLVWAHRRAQINLWLSSAAAGLALVTMFYVLYLMSHDALGARPGVLATFFFGADLSLAAMALLDRRLRVAHVVGGGVGFIVLGVWTMQFISPVLLPWGLVIYLGFAVLHSLFPMVLQRRFPKENHSVWGHLFPVLALIQVLLPILKLEHVSFLVWPVILLVNLLAIGVAVLTASLVGLVLVLLTTLVVAALWMTRIPEELTQLPLALMVIGGFVLVFGAAGIWLGRKMSRGTWTGLGGGLETVGPKWLRSDQLRQQIPALSALLPFLLLVMVVEKLPVANPSAVFGMALLLLGLLLGLTKIARMEWLPPIGLACVFLVEFTWHARHFNNSAHPGLVLGWYLAFYLAVALFPFLFLRGQGDRLFSWISSALSGPLHFFLIYALTKRAWPNDIMGLVPALFAVPTLAGLVLALRQIPAAHPKRNTILACFGGVALLFITLIFPIQFERLWLTMAWALEGVALLWLFYRIPHPGLRVVGVGLLVISFARLALNPAVLSYHPRASVAIFNWYLYTYGLVSVCLFAGARLLPPPDNRVLKRNPQPLLYTLGTILAFILLNIEIADYFSTAGTTTLTFKFSGSFARDMTYSIAWSLFALLLLVIGILKNLKAARYAGIGLLGITLLKLFFHDLASLDQLYRVGALVGVAVVAIVASFLYQKFLSHIAGPEASGMPGGAAGKEP